MHASKRLMWLIAVAMLVTVAAACGGQPAEEPPAEEPAPAQEPVPEPVVPEPVPEPVEPEQPQLEGNIVEVGEGDMGWLNTPTREIPARYYWQVQYRNDTTQTLDITVTFQFVDENDAAVKTDRKTVRVQPADTGTFRVEGEMTRDTSRRVAGYIYSPDWVIVEGS